MLVSSNILTHEPRTGPPHCCSLYDGQHYDRSHLQYTHLVSTTLHVLPRDQTLFLWMLMRYMFKAITVRFVSASGDAHDDGINNNAE